MATIDDGAFESRIGAGTKVSGKLNFKGRTRIEGEAEGEIRGEEIVIAQGANVNARISATRLSVAGRVSGEIIVTERIELLPTARAKCKLTTPKLVLNEGAQFDGECRMRPESGAGASIGQVAEAVPRLAAAGGSGDARA